MKKFSGLIAASILANNAAFAEDIVAAKTIRAGAVIGAGDLVTPDNHEALRRAVNIIGMETRQAIIKGQTIDETALSQPTIINRNAIVQMQFQKGPLTISSEGRALDNGGMGERIRVMNLTSKRIVSVVIINQNTVKALS